VEDDPRKRVKEIEKRPSKWRKGGRLV